MQIKFINLDRSPDRLAQFKGINSHLRDVVRFPAVDGNTLDTKALISAGTIKENILTTYTRGALGNALSHLGLWDQVIDRKKATTICEDDAIFNRHFALCSDSLVEALPDSWDIVVWGWNFDGMMAFQPLPGVSNCAAFFDQEAMRGTTTNFQALQLSPRLFRLERAFGSVCYSLSPKGARVLRERCLPLRKGAVFFPGMPKPIANVALDIMMNGAYMAMEAYVSFPPLVITKNERDKSTVQQQFSG